MIVTEKTSWLRMLFAVHGTTLDRIWPRVAFVTAFAAALTYASVALNAHSYTLTTAPLTVVGLALAIFLGFRNNAAYDRFWEGRKLWGGMVNNCRAFAVQVMSLIQSHETSQKVESARRELIDLTLAYVNALRHRLRGSDPSDDLRQYIADAGELAAIQSHDNIPVAISARIAERITQAWQEGWLRELHVPVLHNSLYEMIGVQGACERIRTTPIPFTYSVLTHRTVMLYCLALPCGLHDSVGILTPVVVAFVAYTFFGLDAVGDEIEQPFGLEDNQLPLHAITRAIEINLLQLAGAESIPAALTPRGNVLQ